MKEDQFKDICHSWFCCMYNYVYKAVPHEETAQTITLDVFEELKKEDSPPADLRRWLRQKADSMM